MGGGGVVAGPNWQPWAGPKAAAASDRVRKIVIDGRKKRLKKVLPVTLAKKISASSELTNDYKLKIKKRKIQVTPIFKCCCNFSCLQKSHLESILLSSFDHNLDHKRLSMQNHYLAIE